MNVVEPSMDMVDAYKDYVNECFDQGVSHYEEAAENPQEALQSIIDAATGENLPEGYLPYKTYFAMEDGQISGAIRYRLGTNEFCENVIGHIGYETRPLRRKAGVATFLYSHVVKNCLNGRALVMCAIDNLGSVKVIESLPHRILGEAYNDHEQAIIRIYEVESPVV